jgi:hypothetical protein
VPEEEVPLQVGATQIEVPVTQTEVLHREFLIRSPVDGYRERIRRLKEPQRTGPQFNLTGRKIRINLPVRPDHNFALDLDNVLGAEATCLADHIRGGRVRIKGDLEKPRPVPEVQEDKPAEIATAMNPPDQPDPGACVFSTERSRKLIAIGSSKIRHLRY